MLSSLLFANNELVILFTASTAAFHLSTPLYSGFIEVDLSNTIITSDPVLIGMPLRSNSILAIPSSYFTHDACLLAATSPGCIPSTA